MKGFIFDIYTKNFTETDSLIFPPVSLALSAIFLRVTDPLSGENKIPAMVPKAAPVKNPASIFPVDSFMVIIFKMVKLK